MPEAERPAMDPHTSENIETVGITSSRFSQSVEYPAGFYHCRATTQLGYTCALNCIKSPSAAGRFDCCELGCGAGKTMNVLAAANPDAHFLGIDLNAAHIEGASQLARDGGLTNARFLATDIQKFKTDELPDFDFITLHSLYTWVPPETQWAITDFIASTLKPGGVVYVSYNALPGWTSTAPIRKFFVDMVGHLDGDITTRAACVLDQLETLRSKGAPFFTANPCAGRLLTELAGTDARYLAHEFLVPS